MQEAVKNIFMFFFFLVLLRAQRSSLLAMGRLLQPPFRADALAGRTAFGVHNPAALHCTESRTVWQGNDTGEVFIPPGSVVLK